MTKHIDIVLAPVDGTPDHTFVEIETDDGKSVKFGEWVRQNDGSPAIRFTAADCAKVFGSSALLRAALADKANEAALCREAIVEGCDSWTAGEAIAAAADALEREAGE
jgi:hypothetical protein